jgi:hypothetical protein
MRWIAPSPHLERFVMAPGVRATQAGEPGGGLKSQIFVRPARGAIVLTH